MVNARLRNPDLATLWQSVYRDARLTAQAKQRLLTKLQALDGHDDVLRSIEQVSDVSSALRAQIARLADLTSGVKLPGMDTPAPDDPVALVDFVSALVLTARQLRVTEREALARKGYSVEGRSTHEAILELLDQFTDVAAPPSMGSADDAIEAPLRPSQMTPTTEPSEPLPRKRR